MKKNIQIDGKRGKLNCRPLAEAVRIAGGKKLFYQEFSTGHYGDDSRNMISRSILTFLNEAG